MNKDVVQTILERHQQAALQVRDMHKATDKDTVIRPEGYQYLNILKKHLGGDLTKIFNGELIYPRQLEFHLPGDGKRACNFNCSHCQGRMGKNALGLDASNVVSLLEEVAGNSEYTIFGGQYTEPTLNPFLIDCIEAAKRNGACFGITTNGSLFKQLEEEKGFISRLLGIATQGDYITVSLDAGFPQSHIKSKNTDRNYFDDIIDGIRILCSAKNRTDRPLIVRVCYLLNKWNSSRAEIENIINIAKKLQIDSLRFSIPYAIYGLDFSKVRDYKNTVELQQDKQSRALLEPYLSKSLNETPYIFYFGPYYQDVDRMNYKQCIHSYYQITFGADGYVYKCSSIAQPLFKFGRLGKAPKNKEQLEQLILKNHDPNFNCQVCFNHGARCNRIALENNYYYNHVYKKSYIVISREREEEMKVVGNL